MSKTKIENSARDQLYISMWKPIFCDADIVSSMILEDQKN